MEEFDWESNMSPFQWSNINHHQQVEESIIFGSEDIFLNPVQDLPKPGPTPTPAATAHQIGSHRQLAPDINVTSSFGSASQYWRQTLNGLHEGKHVIPHTSVESRDYTTSLDNQDVLPLIFSDHIKNFNDVVSSDGSVTKETDNDVVSSDGSGFSNSFPRSKRPRSDPGQSTSSTINFRQSTEPNDTDSEVIAQMKEMVYRTAAFRPVSFAGDEVVEKPKRKNVRISSDPQTVAARKRRERISERIRALQKLVPGGDKMDTASMLDEAANYLKFLRSQVKAFEEFGQSFDYVRCGTSTNAYSTSQSVVHNVTLGVPFPMHAPFLLPHQQIYPTRPPA